MQNIKYNTAPFHKLLNTWAWCRLEKVARGRRLRPGSGSVLSKLGEEQQLCAGSKQQQQQKPARLVLGLSRALVGAGCARAKYVNNYT